MQHRPRHEHPPESLAAGQLDRRALLGARVLVEDLEHLVARPLGHPALHQRLQLVVVPHPHLVGGMARALDEPPREGCSHRCPDVLHAAREWSGADAAAPLE
jgi:hypothetical protein